MNLIENKNTFGENLKKFRNLSLSLDFHFTFKSLPASLSYTSMGKHSRYISWFKDQSGSFFDDDKLEVRFTETDGHGLWAKKAIKKGQILFRIPLESCLTGEHQDHHHQHDDDDEDEDQQGFDGEDSWMPLMIRLGIEILSGDGSRWSPYLDMLPDHFDTVRFWSEEERSSYLKGTSFYRNWLEREAIENHHHDQAISESFIPAIMAKMKMMKSTPAAANWDLKDWRNFYFRVGTIVSSYSFSLNQIKLDEDNDNDDGDEEEEVLEDEFEPVLIPMADLLNHRTGFNNARLFYENEKSLVMKAVSDISADSQVYNTYGDLGNSQLLQKYGFVDSPNPNNELEIPLSIWPLVFPPSPPSSEAEFQERINFLLSSDILDDYLVVSLAEPESILGPSILATCAILGTSLFPTKESFCATFMRGESDVGTAAGGGGGSRKRRSDGSLSEREWSVLLEKWAADPRVLVSVKTLVAYLLGELRRVAGVSDGKDLSRARSRIGNQIKRDEEEILESCMQALLEE